MEGISKEEWSGVVEKLKKACTPVPESLINNYDDWTCRSYAGRAFYALGDLDMAVMILAPLLTVNPDLNDRPDEGFSQAEHKILCLRDMSEIIWKLTKNSEAALRYLGEADRLCREFDGKFVAVDRGKIWLQWLKLMEEAGKAEQAEKECRAMIMKLGDTNGSDPYLYRAYKFLAKKAEKNGNTGLSKELENKSQKYRDREAKRTLTIAEVRQAREELLKKKNLI